MWKKTIKVIRSKNKKNVVNNGHGDDQTTSPPILSHFSIIHTINFNTSLLSLFSSQQHKLCSDLTCTSSPCSQYVSLFLLLHSLLIFYIPALIHSSFLNTCTIENTAITSNTFAGLRAFVYHKCVTVPHSSLFPLNSNSPFSPSLTSTPSSLSHLSLMSSTPLLCVRSSISLQLRRTASCWSTGLMLRVCSWSIWSSTLTMFLGSWYVYVT